MKTQAFGWLAAAVLAAGLNATYHDGGLEWAHRAVDQVEHSSAAVLALASGHADQFLAEARLVSNHIGSDQTAQTDQTDQTETDQIAVAPVSPPACPWTTALARVQAKIARSETNFARLETISARRQARLAQWQARLPRMEAEMAASRARQQLTTLTFNPIVLKTAEIPAHCQKIRINLPRMPVVQTPDPVIHFDVSEADPI